MKIMCLLYLISFSSVAMYGMNTEPMQKNGEKHLGFPEIYIVFAFSNKEIAEEEDRDTDVQPLRRSTRQIKPGPLHVCHLCDCKKAKGHSPWYKKGK